MSIDALAPAASRGTVVAVWAGALVAGVLVVLFSRRADDADWFSISLGACTFGALCLQLATQEKRGFVRRLAASIAGAVVILAVATGVAAVLH